MAKLKDIIQEIETKKAKLGSVPYIEIGDVDVETKLVVGKEKKSVAGAIVAPANSVLVSKVRPSRGAVTLITEPQVVSGGFSVLTPQENICLPKYLFYNLAWNKDFFAYLESRATGVTYPTVKEKDVLEYRIKDLPDIEEQKRIVIMFDELEELRRKRYQINERTTALIPALFSKMFGDPNQSHVKWEMVPLSELGTLDRGKSQHRPRTAPELFGGIYPFVQTGDIANAGWLITEHHQTYSEKGLKQSKLWPKGTLCITVAANIARTAVLDFEACFPDSVVGFIPNELSNVDYVQGLFMFLQRRLEDMAPRAAQLNINLAILRSLKVPKPPKELQDQFAERVNEILTFEEKQKQSAASINNLFQSLHSRSFVAS